MDQALGQMLRQAVYDRLNMLDELAASSDTSSLLSAVRSELPRLTHGWRALLASHAPDPRGRCPECSGHWRSRDTACSVWHAAREYFAPAELDLMRQETAPQVNRDPEVSEGAPARSRFQMFSRLGTWMKTLRPLFSAAVTGAPAAR